MPRLAAVSAMIGAMGRSLLCVRQGRAGLDRDVGRPRRGPPALAGSRSPAPRPGRLGPRGCPRLGQAQPLRADHVWCVDPALPEGILPQERGDVSLDSDHHLGSVERHFEAAHCPPGPRSRRPMDERATGLAARPSASGPPSARRRHQPVAWLPRSHGRRRWRSWHMARSARSTSSRMAPCTRRWTDAGRAAPELRDQASPRRPSMRAWPREMGITRTPPCLRSLSDHPSPSVTPPLGSPKSSPRDAGRFILYIRIASAGQQGRTNATRARLLVPTADTRGSSQLRSRQRNRGGIAAPGMDGAPVRGPASSSGSC